MGIFVKKLHSPSVLAALDKIGFNGSITLFVLGYLKAIDNNFGIASLS